MIRLLRHLIDTIVWGSILALLSLVPRSSRSEGLTARARWKQRLVGVALFIAAAGTLGALLVLAGLIPVKASSRHFAVTRWFLEFSMARGVSTQSLGVKVPELNDRAMVLRGAGQYETTCRPCHGSPELRAPRVAAAMTPRPPYLGDVVSKWEPAELFSIVKHGVKFTGMPAWPVQTRDDEVWAMVAFLQRLPALDAAQYRQLAFGPAPDSGGPAPIEDLAGQKGCARCHGIDGDGRGAFPKLAGQHAPYLLNALRAYERGRRPSGIMEPIAAGLSEQEMRNLAAYYSSMPSPRVREEGGRKPGEGRGYEIAHRGIPALKVPPCADCHGPTDPQPRREYPILAGQYADYIVQQLELFQKGHRGGSEYAHLMQEVAPKLTKQQMREVAEYYASLSPQTDQSPATSAAILHSPSTR